MTQSQLYVEDLKGNKVHTSAGEASVSSLQG